MTRKPRSLTPASKKRTQTLEIERAPQAAVEPRTTKLDAVIALLTRTEGATLDEIVAATGWRRHSARGALAGAVKKKLGAPVISGKIDGVRRYQAPEAS